MNSGKIFTFTFWGQTIVVPETELANFKHAATVLHSETENVFYVNLFSAAAAEGDQRAQEVLSKSLYSTAAYFAALTSPGTLSDKADRTRQGLQGAVTKAGKAARSLGKVTAIRTAPKKA